MNESQFSRELRKALCQYGYFIKQVGGPFTPAGIPDIIGCYGGRFIGIECKQIKSIPKRAESFVWKNLFRKEQIDNLAAIEKNDGKAFGIIELAYKRPLTALCIPAFSLLQINDLRKNKLPDLIDNRLTKGRVYQFSKNNGFWDVTSFLYREGA